jgi:hypothetical protein
MVLSQRRKNKKHDWVAIKEELLRMADDGESRPTASRHALGRLLTYLTCSSHTYYDHDFSRDIKARRPDWFDPSKWKVGRYRNEPIGE